MQAPNLIDSRALLASPPASIPNLAIWFTADTITGLSNGATVQTWPDKSGNGRDATQATSTKRPVWNTNQINGCAAVAFDNTDDMLTTSWNLSANPYTLAVLMRTSLTTGNHRALHGSSNRLLGPYTGAYRYFNGVHIIGPSVTASTWVWLLITQTSTYAHLYVNNQTQAGNTTNAAWGTFSLGHDAGEPLGGDIAEVVGYTRVLTAAEMDTLYNYLRAKYGI